MPSATNRPTIGQAAPLFNQLIDQFPANKGKQILLYFYPKDDTPGCTTEAKDFTALKDEFTKTNTAIIGLSRDSAEKHAKFCQKHGLTIDLIADEDGSICEAYGTWVEKSMYGKTYMGIERSSFLIDAQGTIRAIWPKVKVTGHAEEALAKSREISAATN